MVYNGSLTLHADNAEDAKIFDRLRVTLPVGKHEGSPLEYITFKFATISINLICDSKIPREEDKS